MYILYNVQNDDIMLKNHAFIGSFFTKIIDNIPLEHYYTESLSSKQGAKSYWIHL